MKEDGPKRYICQVMCSISLLDSLLYPCIFSFLTYLPNNLITTFINDLMIHVHDRIVFIRMNLRVNTSPKHFLSALWEYRSFLSYYFLRLLSRSFLTRDDPLPPRIAGLRIPHAMWAGRLTVNTFGYEAVI